MPSEVRSRSVRIAGDTMTGSLNLQSGQYQLKGSPLLNPQSSYSSGSAYVLTNTPSALDFGISDPIIILNSPGTYSLCGRVNVKLNAATFLLNRTLTVKLRRTNNSPGDLINSSSIWTIPTTTLLTETLAAITLPEVFYETDVDSDEIKIFADISAVPTAGTISITEANLTAIRLF